MAYNIVTTNDNLAVQVNRPIKVSDKVFYLYLENLVMQNSKLQDQYCYTSPEAAEATFNAFRRGELKTIKSALNRHILMLKKYKGGYYQESIQQLQNTIQRIKEYQRESTEPYFNLYLPKFFDYTY